MNHKIISGIQYSRNCSSRSCFQYNSKKNYFFSAISLSFIKIPKPNMDGTHSPIKTALRSLEFTNHIIIEKIIDKMAARKIVISNALNFILFSLIQACSLVMIEIKFSVLGLLILVHNQWCL